jgi:hypothetical protein
MIPCDAAPGAGVRLTDPQQDAEKRIPNGKSQMEDGNNPVVLPSAIFHSTSGRTFSAAC